MSDGPSLPVSSHFSFRGGSSEVLLEHTGSTVQENKGSLNTGAMNQPTAAQVSLQGLSPRQQTWNHGMTQSCSAAHQFAACELFVSGIFHQAIQMGVDTDHQSYGVGSDRDSAK